MSNDLGFNLKEGLDYCTCYNRIGFRGVSQQPQIARLIPLSEEQNRDAEIYFFHGVDVSAELLPYLPEMGPDSDFQKSGFWHHYSIEKSIFIAFLRPRKNGSFPMEHVLQLIHFKGEEVPRIFLDRRKELHDNAVLTDQAIHEIQLLLETKGFNRPN